LVLKFDGIDTVDPCKQAFVILADTLEVRFQNSFECTKIRISHGLNDEFLVFTEEKETA
jgi:hypothetical protein